SRSCSSAPSSGAAPLPSGTPLSPEAEWSCSLSLVQYLAGAARSPHALAAFQQLRPDARALVVVGRDDHHVRDVDRSLALGDAALDVALRVGPGVALDEVHALHHHAPLVRQHLQHLAALAACAAGDDLDQVVLADANPDPRLLFTVSRHGLQHLPGQTHDLPDTLVAQL